MSSWSPGTAATGFSGSVGIFGCSDGHYIWVTGNSGFLAVGGWKRYEPSTDTWTSMTRFGASYRIDCAVAYYAGKVYLISGTEGADGGAGANATITRVYDTASDTWSTVASIGTHVHQAQAAVVGSKIYVYGGQGSLLMQVYDIAGDNWSVAAPLPFTDLNVPNQAVVDGTLIHIIGGAEYHGVSDLRQHTTYDTVGNSYSSLSAMPLSLGSGHWGPDGSGAFLEPETGEIWLVVGFADNGGTTERTVTWRSDSWADGPDAQASLGEFRIAAAVDGGTWLVALTSGSTDLIHQAAAAELDLDLIKVQPSELPYMVTHRMLHLGRDPERAPTRQ